MDKDQFMNELKKTFFGSIYANNKKIADNIISDDIKIISLKHNEPNDVIRNIKILFDMINKPHNVLFSVTIRAVIDNDNEDYI